MTPEEKLRSFAERYGMSRKRFEEISSHFGCSNTCTKPQLQDSVTLQWYCIDCPKYVPISLDFKDLEVRVFSGLATDSIL